MAPGSRREELLGSSAHTCGTARSSASPSCARAAAASSSRATARRPRSPWTRSRSWRPTRCATASSRSRSSSATATGDLDLLAEELAAAGAEPGDEPAEGLPCARPRAADAPSPATPFEVFRNRLREQLREIERHDPGTRLGRDPESLHDMRVAVRRLRALLRAGKKLVGDDTGELEAG